MQQPDRCTAVAAQYYEAIYKYCYVRLQYSREAAQDCTQEVFLTLVRKQDTLDFDGNIEAWLYAVASRMIKKQRLLERPYREMLPLDTAEIPDSGGFAEKTADSLPDILTERECQILTAYYDAEHGDKRQLAAAFGLTLPQLYEKIRRIKNKLRREENLT